MEITIEEIRPYLQSLSAKQKEKLLESMLKKDKLLMEQLYFKHLSSEEDLEERYAEFESQLKSALFSRYRAHVDELEIAKAIGEAKKVINQFTKIDKRPEKEADLLMIILKNIFDNVDNPARLGTCWTKYDLAVTQTLKRLITIVRTKLHEDYLLDYKPKIDRYLKRLHHSSSFNDFVYDLPTAL